MGRNDMGQHEAGKHSKAGKARSAANPRMPKKAAKVELPTQPKGQVYKAKGPGFVARLLGKKK
jgi:hypothetical protein